jgi:hypothetical protein
VLCPETRWHRVRDSAWPKGKPLIDKTPPKAVAALLTRAKRVAADIDALKRKLV